MPPPSSASPQQPSQQVDSGTPTPADTDALPEATVVAEGFVSDSMNRNRTDNYGEDEEEQRSLSKRLLVVALEEQQKISVQAEEVVVTATSAPNTTDQQDRNNKMYYYLGGGGACCFLVVIIISIAVFITGFIAAGWIHVIIVIFVT